ncbi:MAG: hypothetical protein OEM60_10725 [Gammaproteobacteria bacterium]|nr:hypothetical protein [Gammaproteobacteria bacterium]MDH3434325.1 hypothetical protein [Gammaproteobacteria bacterium]
MPCKFVQAMDGDVILELWTGSVTLDEMMAHKQRLFADSSIKASASVLSDFTRATFSVSPEDVKKLAEMDNEPGGKSTIGRYAFLVDYGVYDEAQLFAEQVNRHGKSVIVFNSLDLAATWLGMDYATVRELLESIGT